MKSTRFLIVTLLLAWMPGLRAVESETNAAPIPLSEIGTKATADYKGDAIGIRATSGGAELHTGFQKLSGIVTEEGLHVKSMEEEGSGLHLVAISIGRVSPSSAVTQLSITGSVTVEEKLVTFTRPGLTEEYSVSVDGVRQDFIVAGRPAGTGELCVELALSGARAKVAAEGAKLILDGSGRELAYSRLRVTDAVGRELNAKMEVLATDHLVVRVDDTAATYPVRIDPTFSDADWVSMNTGIPGVNGTVYAAVADGSGNLYIGGSFSIAGGVSVSGIAKWNGSEWSNLGFGIGGTVFALAVSGTDLYAGGEFTIAGEVLAAGIAKWNGSAWSSLGIGMVGSGYTKVSALAVSGSDLYAVGNFYFAGRVAANNIAKWNGIAWAALGSGINGRVEALAVSGSDLYAGGQFTTAGGVAANNIAKWNGDAWSALGSGMNDEISTLAVSGSDLYAGGRFTTAGGVAANRIAKWNGIDWTALGSGMDKTVYALVVSGSDLYAGGFFTTAGGAPATSIAKWNGSAWSPLGSGIGIYSVSRALAVMGTGLYAGGSFTTAGGVAANNIAKWNGSDWTALGSGMNNTVSALAVSSTDLYVGGSFTTAGGVAANRIAKWNGDAWSALGSGMNDEISTLAVSGTDLYVGGSFTTAGGVAANRIAKWNGNAWSALGSGMDDSVNELAASGTELYAGGRFTTAGGVAANNIAKWNGSEWSPLGSGMNSSVLALAVNGTGLYAGGFFTTAGGAPANRIAKWNGSEWSALGSGMNSACSALAASGTELYAGGYFTTAGGVAANRIAKWNGDAWSALGSGMNDEISTLAVSGSDLYVGGSFSTVGGVATNRIAKWNGSTWSALGSGISSGVNPNVSALAVSGTVLYVGGSFYVAGTTFSPFIARANLAGTLPTITTPTLAGFSSTSATLGANVTNQGSDTITARGVVLAPTSANANPQLGGPAVTNVPGSGTTGVFTVHSTDLTPATGYTFAAYATNGIGTSYTTPGSFTTLATSSPDITVDSPAIPSGGLKNFPTATNSTPANVTFTINNPGNGDLTGLAVTINGPNASDFTVTSGPAALVIPGGNAVFTVRFAPPLGNGFITGPRSAALHIANNVVGKNPYTINLSGQALSPATDGDGDGQSDASEFNMIALGFDWQVSQPALVSNYHSSANQAGYYSLSQVQSLNVNTPLIQRDPANGQFKLTLGIEKATNLSNFSLFPFTAPQTSINGQGKIEFLFTSPDNAAFFRLNAK